MEIAAIGPPASEPARPEIERAAPAGAVPTELRPDATVRQTSETQSGQDGSGGSGTSRQRSAAVERHLTIDPATHVVVAQVIDERSGELLRQVPDQALLRLYAYARGIRTQLVRSRPSIRTEA